MAALASPLARLLVPLDGSSLAETVLPAVQRLAALFHSHVTLLHILEQNPPATIHGDRHLTDAAGASAYLEDVAARLRVAGVDVETHAHTAREGDVARSIVAHADEGQVDCTVLCTHGGGGLRGFLFGRIAQQVLRHGRRPVLLIPPPAEGQPPSFALRRLLAPLDGSHAHEPALPLATDLACAAGAQLHLVLVAPTLGTLAGPRAVSGMFLPTTMRALLDMAEEGAMDYLERAMRHCTDAGLTVSAEVARGDPVTVVREVAERLDADLIVMATHGRAGLDAWLSGSVAPRVAGRVARPVLLVRAEADDESGGNVKTS